MERDKAYEAEAILIQIRLEEEKKQNLLKTKNTIKEILIGHVEIPEEEIFEAFNKIIGLSKYIDASIEKYYKELKEL